MNRTIFLVVCALLLAALIWAGHSRKPAMPTSAKPAEVQAVAPPVAPPATDDAEAEAASTAQPTEEVSVPASAATTATTLTGTLSRCVDSAGQMTIRQSPCPDGAKTLQVIPYSVHPGAQNVIEIPPMPSTANSPQYVQSQPQSPSPLPVDRCRDARQYAQGERDRLGLNATLDQLRRLNDIVYDACK